MDFSRGSPKEFSRRKRVARSLFAHSKLRKRPFLLKFNRKMPNFKFQMGQGPPCPPPTPMYPSFVSKGTTQAALQYLCTVFTVEKSFGALNPSCVQRCRDLKTRFFGSIRIVLLDDFCSFFNTMT